MSAAEAQGIPFPNLPQSWQYDDITRAVRRLRALGATAAQSSAYLRELDARQVRNPWRYVSKADDELLASDVAGVWRLASSTLPAPFAGHLDYSRNYRRKPLRHH